MVVGSRGTWLLPTSTAGGTLSLNFGDTVVHKPSGDYHASRSVPCIGPASAVGSRSASPCRGLKSLFYCDERSVIRPAQTPDGGSTKCSPDHGLADMLMARGAPSPAFPPPVSGKSVPEHDTLDRPEGDSLRCLKAILTFTNAWVIEVIIPRLRGAHLENGP